MMGQRKRYNAEFKAKVAMEALREQKRFLEGINKLNTTGRQALSHAVIEKSFDRQSLMM